MIRIVAPYAHDPANTAPVYLGVTRNNAEPTEWTAGFKDTIDDQLVVWRDFPTMTGKVVIWIRDRDGARIAHTATLP